MLRIEFETFCRESRGSAAEHAPQWFFLQFCIASQISLSAGTNLHNWTFLSLAYDISESPSCFLISQGKNSRKLIFVSEFEMDLCLTGGKDINNPLPGLSIVLQFKMYQRAEKKTTNNNQTLTHSWDFQKAISS